MRETAIEELDLVALIEDVPRRGLVHGDVGTVVHVYPDGHSYEVEFVASDGETIAVETLVSHQVERLGGRQILHVRPLPAA